MIRSVVAIFDLIHLAANVTFFVVGFNLKLIPAAAFVYMPLILLLIWSVFFGFRSYLIAQLKRQKIKEPVKTKASQKPLTAVLES